MHLVEQEEMGATEDEMVGWHHRLNGNEFEQALRDSEGQGSLVCCSPWGHKESDKTEQLNNSSPSSPFLSLTSICHCLNLPGSQIMLKTWKDNLNGSQSRETTQKKSKEQP